MCDMIINKFKMHPTRGASIKKLLNCHFPLLATVVQAVVIFYKVFWLVKAPKREPKCTLIFSPFEFLLQKYALNKNIQIKKKELWTSTTGILLSKQLCSNDPEKSLLREKGIVPHVIHELFWKLLRKNWSFNQHPILQGVNFKRVKSL